MTQPAKPSAIPAPPPVPIRGTDPFPVFATKSANWVDWQSGSLYQYIVDSIDFIDLSNTYVSERLTLATDAAAAASSSADSAAASAASALDSKTLAEAAVASIPAGSINDLIIAPDKAWSSEKINNELELKTFDLPSLIVSNWRTSKTSDDAAWYRFAWSDFLRLGIAVSTTVGSGGSSVMRTSDGETWENVSSPNEWLGVAWSPALNLFCFVSYGGLISTSQDGITLTPRTSGTTNGFRDVIWAAELGIFVAICNSGTGDRVSTSPDGINWTQQTTPADNAWNSVVWSGSLLVAVSSNGTSRVMTSPDGINWTLQNIAFDTVWNDVAFFSGFGFIAVGSITTETSNIMRSSDGINWSLVDIGSIDGNFTSIDRLGDLDMFVAVASSGKEERMIASKDLDNWYSVAVAKNNWNSVTYVDHIGGFVCLAGNGENRSMKSIAFKEVL